MTEDRTFKFPISLSKDRYPTKESIDYTKMKLKVIETTASELLLFIRQGHSYVHIFKDNKRAKNNFLRTNVISVDMDDSTIPMKEQVTQLKFKPTFAYTSSSNGLPDKGFRFRLVYVFTDPICSVLAFEELYHRICSSNALDPKDNCAGRVSQLMNGNTKPNIEVYESGYLYRTTDFMSLDEQDNLKQRINPKVQNETLELSNNNSLQYISNVQNWTDQPTEPTVISTTRKLLTKYGYGSDEEINKLLSENQSLLKDYWNHSDMMFTPLHYHIHLIQETQLPFNEDGYHVFKIDEEYYKIYIRYRKDKNGKTTIKRYVDDERRRKKLNHNCYLLKKIKRDISLTELLYNIVYIKNHYFDNTDGVITKTWMLDVVSKVLCCDIDEYKCECSKHPKLTTDKEYCRVHGLNRRSYSRECQKKERHSKIGEWYDLGLSVGENYKTAKKEGWYEGSLKTLQRFCAENGINPNPNRRPIEEWYDSSKTAKENLEWAKSEGIKVSRSAVFEYRKSLIQDGVYVA